MTAPAANSSDPEPARQRAHPLTLFGFDALVAGAARPRPGALAFSTDDGVHLHETTYADLYQRVGACLAQLRAHHLAPGEIILICCPPDAQSFVILTAALAAGLIPVITPLPLPHCRDAVASAATSLDAAALVAPAQFGGLDLEAPLLALVAAAPSIRFVATLAGALDGAADFSTAALDAPSSPRVRLTQDWDAKDGARVGALGEGGRVDFSSQGALLGAALDLVRATRAAGDAPFLSLSAPSSLCALVAGPLAALLAGAPLHFLAPFTTARFLERLDALGPTRLVAPASLVADLGRAGLLVNGALAGVAALRTDADASPLILEAVCPIIELCVELGVVNLRAAGLSPF